MDDTLFAHIISNVGIPAALCFYTLFEVNKNVKKLAESIDRFSDDIDKRVNKIETDLRELTVEVKALMLDIVRAQANGKQIDGVGDLPRVLRTPCTFNYKLGADNAPICHIFEDSGLLFNPD